MGTDLGSRIIGFNTTLPRLLLVLFIVVVLGLIIIFLAGVPMPIDSPSFLLG
jgi:hypothetical protein